MYLEYRVCSGAHLLFIRYTVCVLAHTYYSSGTRRVLARTLVAACPYSRLRSRSSPKRASVTGKAPPIFWVMGSPQYESNAAQGEQKYRGCRPEQVIRPEGFSLCRGRYRSTCTHPRFASHLWCTILCRLVHDSLSTPRILPGRGFSAICHVADSLYAMRTFSWSFREVRVPSGPGWAQGRRTSRPTGGRTEKRWTHTSMRLGSEYIRRIRL
jgi:hypothetical protein